MRHRNTAEWAKYLRERCAAEGIKCDITEHEVTLWLTNAIDNDEPEDEVFESFRELLSWGPPSASPIET